LRGLENDPRPPGSIKLHGEEDLHRIRVGDYRILYQIQDAILVVLVVEIGHRREIYRQ
jgi:mRNA interferase RelE/StbE